MRETELYYNTRRWDDFLFVSIKCGNRQVAPPRYLLSVSRWASTKVLTAFSYMPKKIHPPIEIQSIRGPMPANKARLPSSALILCSVEMIPVYGFTAWFYQHNMDEMLVLIGLQRIH